MRVALMVPDRSQAQLLMTCLDAEQREYSCCENGAELTACLDQAEFVALVLDGSARPESARQLLKQVRRDYPELAILWLAPASDEVGVVEAMALGVDDYLFLPAPAEAIVSRLKVLCSLRKSQPAASAKPVLRCGPFAIDYQQRRITRKESALELTEKDFSLAVYMFEHVGELLSRQQLLEDVWGLSNQVNTRTVDMHMSRVRKALDLSGTGFEIKTVHQQGYRLERL